MRLTDYPSALILRVGFCALVAIASALLLLQWREEGARLQQVAAQLSSAQRAVQQDTERQLNQLNLLTSSAHWQDISPYAPAAWLSLIRRKAGGRAGISAFKAAVFERLLRTELIAADIKLISVPIEIEFHAESPELALEMLQDIEHTLGQYVAVSHLSLERQTRREVVQTYVLRCRVLHYAVAAPT